MRQDVRIELGGDFGQLRVVPGLPVGIAKRQHRAAPVIEHRVPLLINGANPQHGYARRGASGARAILLQRNDLGRGVQGISDPGETPEDQPAVEEVRDHAPRQQGRLAVRDVPDQRRIGDRAAGNGAAQIGVQREPEPVAHDRAMERGESVGQRERGRVGHDLTDLEILEEGTVNYLHVIHQAAPPRLNRTVLIYALSRGGPSLVRASLR